MPENLNDIRQIVIKLLASGSPEKFQLFIKKYHEADIAEALQELSSQDRQNFFLKVNPELSTDVLEELTIDQQVDIISKSQIKDAAKIIEEMHPDDAADLFEELLETNEDKAEEIMNALPDKEQSELKSLLSYEEDSAGSLMTSDYLSIPENLSIHESLAVIKQQNPPDSEVSFYIFIVSKANNLKGYITLRDLIMTPLKSKVKDLRVEYPINVHYSADQEEVTKLFQKYNMSVIPVIDDDERLLGVITVDDVVDVMIEEANEDVFKLSGTVTESEEKLISGSIFRTLLYRTPWLLITIIGGLVASFVITEYSLLFKEHLFSLALSLSFVPLLMGLGGNVGNQSSAIIVRGLATGTVSLKNSFSILFREIVVGLSIGLVIALFLFLTNHYLSDYSLVFSVIVSVALLSNIIVATFLGTALPLIFNRFNIDPAVASAPFISSALDVIGQVIYFSITLFVLQTLI